jgi:hypothetical protein
MAITLAETVQLVIDTVKRAETAERALEQANAEIERLKKELAAKNGALSSS